MSDDFHDEVPDADALEQRRAVDDEDDADVDEIPVAADEDSLETPDADRLEQTRDAGVPEDDR